MYISKYVSLISVTYVVDTHWNCLIEAMHLQHMSIQKMNVFHHELFFTIFRTILLVQCNEHVEMNTFLCSLACIWMTIIDSQ